MYHSFIPSTDYVFKRLLAQAFWIRSAAIDVNWNSPTWDLWVFHNAKTRSAKVASSHANIKAPTSSISRLSKSSFKNWIDLDLPEMEHSTPLAKSYFPAFGEDALHRFVLVPHKVTHLQNVAAQRVVWDRHLYTNIVIKCDKLVKATMC